MLLFLLSYQVRSNKGLFAFQILGCLAFMLQFLLLGAYSGCLSLLINIVRNTMLLKYKDYKCIRWKGWIVVFSALAIIASIYTWNGFISLLPVLGTIAGTIGYWSNNARIIRLTNLAVISPSMLTYDVVVRSWGGVLNESITILSIVISIARFGFKALDGDVIEKEGCSNSSAWKHNFIISL